MGKNKQLSPKLDVVFKMIFGEQKNEKPTKALLEDLLKEKIDVIDLEKTPYLMGTAEDDKLRNNRRKSSNKRKK